MQITTRMRYVTFTAADVADKITKALEKGARVVITDGTEWRNIESVELDRWKLFMQVEGSGWIVLEISNIFGRLDGWDIGESAGVLTIAPAWWWRM